MKVLSDDERKFLNKLPIGHALSIDFKIGSYESCHQVTDVRMLTNSNEYFRKTYVHCSHFFEIKEEVEKLQKIIASEGEEEKIYTCDFIGATYKKRIIALQTANSKLTIKNQKLVGELACASKKIEKPNKAWLDL